MNKFITWSGDQIIRDYKYLFQSLVINSTMDPDLQLDPQNPPKYCPQCARSGIKSKVKKFKMDPNSKEVVIMCKNEKVFRLRHSSDVFILLQCPWPFSVQSQAGATVVPGVGGADDSSATSSASEKSSRKKKHTDTLMNETTTDESLDTLASIEIKKAKVDYSHDVIKSKNVMLPDEQEESSENISSQEDQSVPSVRLNDVGGCVGGVKNVSSKHASVTDEENLNAIKDFELNGTSISDSFDQAQASVFLHSPTEIPLVPKSLENSQSPPVENQEVSPLIETCAAHHTSPHGETQQMQDSEVVSSPPSSPSAIAKIILTPRSEKQTLKSQPCVLTLPVSKSLENEQSTPVSGKDDSPLSQTCDGHETPASRQESSSQSATGLLSTVGSSTYPSLEPGLVIESEHAVFAVSAFRDFNLVSNENYKMDKQCDVITRRGRKVKPTCDPEAKKGRRGTAGDKNTYGREKRVPAVKPVLRQTSEIENTGYNKVLPCLSDKSNSPIPNDSSIDDSLIEEEAESLEEKRIQSLIKPPYPRRRQTIRKISKEINSDAPQVRSQRVRKPSSKFKETTSKPIVKKKLEETAEEPEETLSEYLVTGVTRALETQMKEKEKKLEIKNISDIVRVVETMESPDLLEEDILLLKPRRTFERVRKKKDLFTFQPSPVPEVLCGNINIDAASNDKENPCSPVHFMSPDNVKDTESARLLKLGTGVLDVISDVITESECVESVLVEFDTAPQQLGSETARAEVIEASVIRLQSLNNNERSQEGSWFWWRGWKVDSNFMVDFTNYMRKLMIKWKPTKSKTMDPRIFALMKEKEENKENPKTVLKMISFFSQVFVKYLYIKTHFLQLEAGTVLNILKENHSLNNQQFTQEMKLTKELTRSCHQKNPTHGHGKSTVNPTVSNPTLEVSKLIETFPPAAHCSKPLMSPCSVQPINLSSSSNIPYSLSTTPVDPSTKDLPMVVTMEEEKKSGIQDRNLLDKKGKGREHFYEETGSISGDVNSFDFDVETNGLVHSRRKMHTMSMRANENSGKSGKKRRISEWDNGIDESIPQEKIAEDVMKIPGRKSDTGGTRKTSLSDMKIGMKDIRSEIREKRGDKANKQSKIYSEGDGEVINKLLNFSKNISTPVSCGLSEDKVPIANNASRRKNSIPAKMNHNVDENVQQPQENKVKDVGVASINTSKTSQKSSSPKTSTFEDEDSNDFGSFGQAYARKKQAEKVKLVLLKQKRKAETGTDKKYAGFGETVEKVDEYQKKKRRKEKSAIKEIVKKSAQVSKSERDLMEELLSIADTAVATTIPMMYASITGVTVNSIKQTPVNTPLVFDFEEFQTLPTFLGDEESVDEDVESLFQF